MGSSNGNLKDSGFECDLTNCGVLTQEASEKKSFSILPRDCYCDILVKKVAAFCPCPKSLPESFRLIP